LFATNERRTPEERMPDKTIYLLRQIEYVVREHRLKGDDPQMLLKELDDGEFDGPLAEQDSGILANLVIPLRKGEEDASINWVGVGHWPDQVHVMVTQVPSYNGNSPAYRDQPEGGPIQEYGEPYRAISIQQAEGLNLWLGTADIRAEEAMDRPNVLIERQHNKWAVVISAKMGDEPEVAIYITDDHRVVVVPNSRPPASNLEYSDEAPD
jgi:hypothetical protein